MFVIGVGVNKPLLYRINNDINMLLIIQSLPSSFKIQNIKELNLVLRYFLSLSLSLSLSSSSMCERGRKLLFTFIITLDLTLQLISLLTIPSNTTS